jgi:hypothetical protein
VILGVAVLESRQPPLDDLGFVTTQDDLAVAACHSVEPDRWVACLDELMGRVAGRFARVEPRRDARALVAGLLAGLPRANCWTVAEFAGARSPDALQHLLSRASWDHAGVRDDLRGYGVEHLGAEDGVLVVDETGDVKKGTGTVGLQRQYTGTAGLENAQVTAFTAQARSTWSTPAAADTRSSTGSCTCRGPGPMTTTGGPRPACPPTPLLRPNRRWPPR